MLEKTNSVLINTDRVMNPPNLFKLLLRDFDLTGKNVSVSNDCQYFE